MNKAWFAVKALLAFMVSAILFAGCTNFISGSGDSEEYGSVSVNTSNRAVYTDDIKSVIVTVTGYSSSGTKYEITSDAISISSGVGSATIGGIPVSKNVAVKVQAYSDSSATSKIDGLVMYAMKDEIAAGSDNSVSISQATSRVGSVFAQLIASGINTNKMSDTEVAKVVAAVPSSTNYSLIDAASIVSDYKSDSLQDSSNYIKTAATLTVTPDNVSGYTVQISDPNSTISEMSTSTVTYSVAPGSWTIYAIDSDGNVAASEGITLSSGDTASATVKKTTTSSTDFSDDTILFVKADSAPTVWAWEVSGDSVALSAGLGQDWNSQPSMTAVTSDYMTDYSGWLYCARKTKQL